MTSQSDAQPLALVVRFTLRSGANDDFDALVARTVDQIRAHEPGTLVYAVHASEPDLRLFYELYESNDAFEAHERQPHVQHFLAEREQYLDRTEVDFLSLVTSAGLPAVIE